MFSGTHPDDYDSHPASEWPELWESVQAAARQMGWEGDIREGPSVTVLPREPGEYEPGHVIVAWKQHNNGTTFLASPIRLPWLETEDAEWEEFP